MPMVERCSSLAGDDDEPGYVRLVLGFMFPQQDGERSCIKERLVSLDSSSHSGLSRISLQILLLFNSYVCRCRWSCSSCFSFPLRYNLKIMMIVLVQINV
ncbi:hypothetical protein AAZX31_01G065600 [Glycine max]